MDGGFKPPLEWLEIMLDRAPAIGAEWSSRELDRFVTGASNGETLLHAIYDEVIDEPVPAHLQMVMRGDKPR